MDWRVDQLSEREVYKLLVSTIVPRPIALVTTRNANGVSNAAPFSFFNILGSEPPIVALGLEANAQKQDGLKDTARNIADNGEFVVNLVDEALARSMNICGIAFPDGVEEAKVAGLTLVPGKQVLPCRIAESPVQLECRLHTNLAIGPRRQVVIGEVVHIHIRNDIVDQNLHIDLDRLNVIGRLHGSDWYVRTTDRFQSPKLSIENWPAP